MLRLEGVESRKLPAVEAAAFIEDVLALLPREASPSGRSPIATPKAYDLTLDGRTYAVEVVGPNAVIVSLRYASGGGAAVLDAKGPGRTGVVRLTEFSPPEETPAMWDGFVGAMGW